MASLLAYPQIPLNFTTNNAIIAGHSPFPGGLHRNAFVIRASAVSHTTKRKKQQQKEDEASLLLATTTEKGLRLLFMEDLMERARSRDVAGVSEVIYDMIAAGINPGPRSFHGLVISHVLNGDHEGAMNALRRELSEGLCPLPETFNALIRLFGSKGYSTRGLELLGAMEKLTLDIRFAWLILIEELIRSNHLDDANKVFLKGAEGRLRASDEIYDLLIEEDCKVGDHSNALTIAYKMEEAGRMATTYHFNCLLSCQATCGIPEIAYATFENMVYGEDSMKPDTETYNWVIQAYTRAESSDRVQDVAAVLGMMVEDYRRVQPNAIGGMLCQILFRRIVELLEALEAMAKENQTIPARAMVLSQKYRTMVSSWIEPLQTEADVGYEIDYIARYIEEGGLTGERKRWVPREGKTSLDPDVAGFVYKNPLETSFRQRCVENWKRYHRKILRALRNRGPSLLGDVSESEYVQVVEWLYHILKRPNKNALKPKAASKMVVSELMEELEAQGLPTDGNRSVLYQRVQKARRINRSRNKPLWIDEEVEALVSRVRLEEGNTEFWRRRFLGEGLDAEYGKSTAIEIEVSDVSDDPDGSEDVTKQGDDDEADKEEVLEQTESQSGDTEVVKDKEAVAANPLQMIGVQLFKGDSTPARSKKSQKRLSRIAMENDDDEDWFPLDIQEALKEMRNRKVFDVSDMYTIADAWGWTWEMELRNTPPRRWSQQWEVELAVKLMVKVIELGGKPTIGDCAIILRAAMRAPYPAAFLEILRTTHSLGYVFGSPLYDEAITLCLDLGELDAAIAIVADLETSGISVPDETLDRIIQDKQTSRANVNGTSL
ncbi:Pentatricopeptide repeat-containing protein [Cynara cardunculus var. scolymus]|uniref:Pentatricopeptide repeat-containing protein n=1 Tax=Cynara cardunculus var. scolymus TaxID=59895 RepID=A0A103YEZ6_CYNCS|nr:Pentatricopeptide repeat-containing protein [Cynara cardunculus var. scolymus]